MDNGGTRRIPGSYLAGSCVRVFLSRNKGDGAWLGKKEGERERGKWRVGGGGGGGKPRRRINRSGFQARACESGDQWSREGSFDESGRPWAKRGRGHGGGGGVCDAQGRLPAHPKLSSLPCFLFFFLLPLFYFFFPLSCFSLQDIRR